MPAKRRRRWLGFIVPAVLAILALFVLHGPAAGVAALATLLAFIGACMNALRGQDSGTVARNERSSLGGWIGNWF